MLQVIVTILPLCILIVAESTDLIPPTIVEPERARTIYVNNGKRLTLECRAEGNPKPGYKWYKILDLPTGKMEAVKLVDNEIAFNAADGSLTFYSFYGNMNGHYMCLANNRVTQQGKVNEVTTFSPVIQVLASSLPEFSNADQPKSLSSQEYTYTMIECSGRGEVVGDTIINSWYVTGKKSGSQGQEQKQLDLDDGRLYVDTKGNLHITYVKRSDSSNAMNGKGYSCAIGTDKTIRLGQQNKLEVQQDDNPVAVKPRLVYHSQNATFKRFTTAVLECVFDGYQPTFPHLPKIIWKDGSYKEISSNGRYVISNKGRRLEIKNVQETDDGNYFCEASNSDGKSQLVPVTLDVTSPPIWQNNEKEGYYGSPTDQTAPEGSTVTFNCDARSALHEQAPGKPIWFVNGVKYGSHSNKYEFDMSDDAKHLKLMNVKKTDTKCVQCMVSNKEGTTLGDGCLTVILKIDIITRPKPVQRVSYGEVVDLTVVATTDPSVDNLQYQWIFRNKTYPNNSTKEATPEFVVYNTKTLEAYINTSSLTKEEYMKIGGNYTRRVHHEHDSVMVEVQVIIEGEIAPIVQSAGFDMWIIGLIIGIIFLIIVIIIIIFIICRKQQEGDYNVDKKETGAGLDPEKELKSQGFDDYSRPDYSDYDYPDRKPRGDLEYDDVPIGGDDESLGEYGDEEATYFNEDGSFIGIYQSHEAPPKPQYSAESTI